MRQQKCSYFNTNGGCRNPSELLFDQYPVDMCAKHNHMERTGMPIKCWRCGDKERK